MYGHPLNESHMTPLTIYENYQQIALIFSRIIVDITSMDKFILLLSDYTLPPSKPAIFFLITQSGPLLAGWPWQQNALHTG